MKKLKALALAILIFITSLFFSSQAFAASSKDIVNPRQKYSYKQMVSDIKSLQKKYPDIIKFEEIGKTEYKRKIYAVMLGEVGKEEGKAQVFINGAHHAREWLTTNLNMHMLEQYAKAVNSDKKFDGYNIKKILKSCNIWFVPMVNPDGVVLAQKGASAFPKDKRKGLISMNKGSKNFDRWKANGKGVDLNRQYDADWKTTATLGVTKPNYQHYKGKKKVSAAETKAIVKFVNKIKPVMAVAYHSTGKVLYWNYKQNKANYKRDKVYADKISSLTGYRLIYHNGGNTTGSGFTDWFVLKQKSPGFTPEICKSRFESSPPVSEFDKTWSENRKVGAYVASESIKLHEKWAKVTGFFSRTRNAISKMNNANKSYVAVNKQPDVTFKKLIDNLKIRKAKLDKKTKALKKLPPYRKSGVKHSSLNKEITKSVKVAENYIKNWKSNEETQ